MSITPLPDWAKGALWIGLGGLVGLAAGAILVDLLDDRDTVSEYAFPWLVVVAAYTGVILLLARRQNAAAAGPAPAPAAPAAAPRPRAVAPAPRAAAPGHALHLAFDMPDVPPEFPPVMGHNEPLRVKITVTHLGKAAIGAAVRVTGQLRDGPQFVAGEGVTGADGAVMMKVTPHGTGELLLEAEARLEKLTGAGQAAASIVRYDEEIERLFGEFRSYAINVLGPDSQSDTARELAERLREGSPPEVARALLELARIYELVAYGERDADRALYLQLLHALLVLERGDLPDPPGGGGGGAGGGPRTRTAEV